MTTAAARAVVHKGGVALQMRPPFGERCALPFRRVRQHEAPDADLADGLVLDVQKLTEKAQDLDFWKADRK